MERIINVIEKSKFAKNVAIIDLNRENEEKNENMREIVEMVIRKFKTKEEVAKIVNCYRNDYIKNDGFIIVEMRRKTKRKFFFKSVLLKAF